MSPILLIKRNLLYHWRSNLAVMCGGAIGCMIIVGSLLVGESVRGSLRELALSRIGKTDWALETPKWLLHNSLGREVAKDMAGMGTSALHLQGFATTPEETRRANNVNLYGIVSSFWRLTEGSEQSPAVVDNGKAPGPGEVWLNESLQRQMDVKLGDTIIVTVNKPGEIPIALPFIDPDRYRVSIRLKVSGFVPAESLGNFSLRSEQALPYNAFVNRDWLQRELEADGVNLILISSKIETNPERALLNHLRFDDLDVRIRRLPDGIGYQIDSERVFLPVLAGDLFTWRTSRYPSRAVLYSRFVNSISTKKRSTPYSVVCGIHPTGGGRIPSKSRPLMVGDNDIVVTDWLAEDLDVTEGDPLTISYYDFQADGSLKEATFTLYVTGILPIDEIDDPWLTPTFPGISELDNCREWDPDFPIDLSMIRQKDEDYWDKYGTMPKAFIDVQQASRMWAGLQNNATGLRIYDTKDSPEAVEREILPTWYRHGLGFSFRDVREEALSASLGTTDFSGLFAGLSFFLLVAALIMVALLYRLDAETRLGEVATLRALGFGRWRLRFIRLSEAFVIAIGATILGMVLAAVYTRAVIHGLQTVWAGAGAPSNLVYRGARATYLEGGIVGLAVIMFTIIISLRGQMKTSVSSLLKRIPEVRNLKPQKGAVKRTPGGRSFCMGVLSSLVAILLILYSIFTASMVVETFFVSGMLLLLAFIVFTRWSLERNVHKGVASTRSLLALSQRSLRRRSFRVVAAAGILACGIFLLVSVGVHRQTGPVNPSDPSSGTGGYELYATTVLPILEDLNTEEGLGNYGLTKSELPNVSFLQFRVHQGDEASCLNLNKPQQPTVLGADIKKLTSRPGFGVLHEEKAKKTLSRSQSNLQSTPVYIDETTAKWSLKVGVGDTLLVNTSERYALRGLVCGLLSPSILQGSVIIDEDAFPYYFRDDSGFRMFLIDCPIDDRGSVSEKFTKAFRDYGMSVEHSEERLIRFRAVENTYLAIFQVLGGLGLILGTLGLGIALVRNALERRSEMALMMALGFTKRRLRWYLMWEHTWILLLGTAFGTISGLVAMVPAVSETGRMVALTVPSVMLLGVVACGTISIYIATSMALKGKLIRNLRNE